MEEFRKKLMEELNRKLGKGYELWVTDVNKNNGTILHGISILKDGEIGGPTIYVDNLYQTFRGTSEEVEKMVHTFWLISEPALKPTMRKFVKMSVNMTGRRNI